MARKLAVLPKGTRITDYISLGEITKTFPLKSIHRVLRETGKASVRQRALPAHVMVYYVVALALYMQSSTREVMRCLLEGLNWLTGPNGRVHVAGDAGISRARTRLGYEPLKRLHDELLGPVAEPGTRGAWYRHWRVVSIDGGTLAVPDTVRNDREFGRPQASRGRSACPKVRFVALVEGGTHVPFGTRLGAYATSELALSRRVVERLEPGMLCLADQDFFEYKIWNKSRQTGADLVWKLKANQVVAHDQSLGDGSYRSRIYASQSDRRRGVGGVEVRVVEYRLEGVEDTKPLYRLATTVLDPERAPARELAALYHERWEIGTALEELNTHPRGNRVVLRSKTPDLVRQEFYGLLLAHFAVRKLMHEAALKADEDPDRLSFVHAVRVIRRKLSTFAATPPSGQTGPA